jgi:L-ascorbate metabolism protein UlaG (beta-lactamase superfamily)
MAMNVALHHRESRHCWWLLAALSVIAGFSAFAQIPAEFTSVRRLPNGDVDLRLLASSGSLHRIESSTDLQSWQRLVTLSGANTAKPYLDTTRSSLGARFYRSVVETDTHAITGDHVPTDAGDVVVHPVNHASFVLRWQDRFIYNDPVGSLSLYAGVPKPHLILVSHSHGDHLSASTLDTLQTAGTLIIAPAAVYSALSAKLKAMTIPLANGQNTNVLDLNVEAIPAYNANHPKGVGNGYVLTLGGRRFYISGDTGNISEMRALPNIDVAFVCMNVPFTMTISDAVAATRAFLPRVLYPYHYRNQDSTFADLNSLKRQLSDVEPVEVRLRAWY